MARAAGGRVLSPGVPGEGMNPFVIDKGDSEEMLQRIGSLRRLIEVMVGESLGAERRASLDHALAGYYARPRERTGFRDFYQYLQEDEAGDAGLARLLRPFATGSLRHLLSDEGDDLLGERGPGDGLRPAAPRTGAASRRRDGLHRDGVGRRRPGPQAPPAGRGRGVVDHAAPRRRGLHGVDGEAGALSALYEGERVVARLLLRSLGPDWSQAHMDKAHKQPGMEPREPAYTFQTKPLQMDGVTMAVLGIGALAALKGYLWVQDGEIWKAALLGTGAALGLAVGGWAWHRWKKARKRVEDPILIREKVSRIAFDAELQVTAILPPDTMPQRAGELLGRVAAAYRHFDNPAGARFKAGKVRPVAPDPSLLHPSGSGLFGGRSVLGVREVACLWHPPGAGDETPLVERSGARALSPSAKGVRGGALVGDTTAGAKREIRFPEDLLRRHHLYVARTRMGKSTLMHHLVTHKMREKAAGRDPDAIVVIDPHTDLAAGILEHVPESLIDRVRLIDLSDESRSPGINLLDTRIFANRDRTADSVVRVAKGLWEQWGPRMQSILEQTVKTLHEANEQVEAGEQYTILDGLKLLTDEPFRKDVLKKVSDPYLLEWWARDFGRWNPQYRAEALAPVQTRLSYYASSKRARAILGQRRSTIDLRRTVHDGGLLLVSTSQGTVGRDVAALVGASLLNLVDAVIREQGSLPLNRRRGALVVVDEMQSMPGVDYESMLSELGKFGASFILATQSLAKLDDLSRTMRDTLLANVGCLAVFQVAGNDARTLVWELGKERVSEDDITSLPVHHCYVRATVGTERMPAFSMMVRKPEEGDPAVAARIREAATAYTVSARQADYADADGHKKVDDYRKGVEDLENARQKEGKDRTADEHEEAEE